MAIRLLANSSAQGRQLLQCLHKCPQCRRPLQCIAVPGQRKQQLPFTRRANVQRSLHSTPVCMSQKAPGVELHGEAVRVNDPSPPRSHCPNAPTLALSLVVPQAFAPRPLVHRLDDAKLRRTGPCALRAVADWQPARRRRTHRALQLPLREETQRQVDPQVQRLSVRRGQQLPRLALSPALELSH